MKNDAPEPAKNTDSAGASVVPSPGAAAGGPAVAPPSLPPACPSPPAAKLKIKYLATDKLIPYARNARTHSKAQISAIVGSIREFGFTNPVLLGGGGGILAGHGRMLAAQALDIKRVPTIDLTHLTETQQRAYVIADNQLATKAGWDKEMMGLEMADLSGLGFDLKTAGFTAKQITDISAVPALEPASIKGQARLDRKKLTRCPACDHEFEI